MPLVNVNSGRLISYLGPETAFILRIKNRITFVASDGTPVIGENSGSDDFFFDVPCTVAAGQINHDAFSFYSTTDAITFPPDDDEDVFFYYRFDLHTTDGDYHSTLFRRMQVPPTTPTTLAALIAFNGPPPITASLLAQIFAYIASLFALITKATNSIFGLVKLDVPADDPANPRVVGINSPLLTMGGVSTTRKYRKAYASFLAAKAAAAGGELVFDLEEAIAADSSLDDDILTSVEGDGIFNIAATRTLAIKHAYSWGDRRIAKGPGMLVQHGGAVVNAVNYVGNPYETTLNGVIDNFVTTMTLTDASGYGTAPFVVCIDREMIYVGARAGNVCSSLMRGYDGTTAASHLDGAATFIGIAANQWAGIKTSCQIMGAGVVVIPPGKYGLAAPLDFVDGMTLAGCGGDIDGNGGTIFKMLLDSSDGLYIGDPSTFRKDIHVDNITIDAIGTTGNTPIRISGPNGTNISHVSFTYCRINDGDYGAHVYDDTPSAFGALVLGVSFKLCWFISQKIACFRSNTVNGSNEFELCQFTPTANTTSVCYDLDYAGPTGFELCTFNGVNVTPQTIHTNIASINTTTNLVTTTGNHGLTVGELELVTIRGAQAITNTVAAPAGITADGNARNIITAAGFNGGVPLTVTTALTIATHTTAPLIATAMRASLNASGTVTAFFTVGGTGAEITLTKNTLNDNDGTLNFTIEDVTSAGITEDLTSSVYTGNLPNGSVNINRTGDIVNLHQQKLYFLPTGATTGYCYLDPNYAFLGNESDFRYNFTDDGVGTMQLRTNSPVRTGRPYAVGKISNTHTGVKHTLCQSEGFPYEVVVDNTYEKQKSIVWDTCIIQGIVKLRSRCMVSLVDCWAPAHILSDISTASFATNATVEIRNCGVAYDGILGGYKDLGNTIVTDPTLIGFVGDSMVSSETGPDLTENRTPSHSLTTIGQEYSAYDLPVHEFTRNRPFFERIGIRIGLKEQWQRKAIQFFFDLGIIDNLPGPTYPHTLRHLHIKPNNAAPWLERGVFVDGHLTARGRRPNVHQEPLFSVANVVDMDVELAEYYYLNNPGENTTINLSGTIIGGDPKIIHIEATTTNYFIGFGNGILAEYPKGFNTGYLAGVWVVTLEPLGGTYCVASLIFTPSSGGVGAKPSHMPTVYITGTSGTGAANHHHLINNAALCTVSLPANANVGDRFSIKGMSTGGWKISQAANQYVIFEDGGVDGTDKTTTGVTGYIQSVNPYAAIELECIDAGLGWSPSTVYGNLTIN